MTEVVRVGRAPADLTASLAASPKPAFRPNYVEGYTHALLSSLGYGASPIFIALGLKGGSLGESLAGGLVSYTAAAALVGLLVLWPGQSSHIRSIETEAAKWFTISGAMVCLSQIFRYMSIAIAPVSVVAPIQRLSIVFRIYFGWMLNREHEIFGRGMVLATTISLIGALALSISTEFVLSTIPLPDALAEIARWQWP